MQVPAGLERHAAELSNLHVFVRTWWGVVEPARLLDDDPHVAAICAHLEAVAAGRIRTLVIAVPPRTGKSLIVSVLFPVWWWLRAPTARFLCASYGERLALHHSVLCRSLVRAPAFHAVWGRRVRARTDQDEKARFDLTRGGYRLATSVGGAVTGVGGDVLIVDDPANVVDAASAAKRAAVRQWYTSSFSTRTDDPARSRTVLVCQRTHADDLAGLLLDQGAEALVLPMVADPAVGRVSAAAAWTDRRAPGDLLCPARYPPAEVAARRRALGREFGTQYQQDPAPAGGGLFDRADIRVLEARPAGVSRRVRAWDCAGTAGGGDATAGVLMGATRDGRYVVLDVRRGHWGPGEVQRQIVRTAEADGRSVPVVIEQEAGAAGKHWIASLARALPGYDVTGASVTGGKEGRARPLAAQVQAGNVDALRAAWTDDWVDELAGFPGLRYDDRVDASAHAFNALTAGRAPGTFRMEPR